MNATDSPPRKSFNRRTPIENPMPAALHPGPAFQHSKTSPPDQASLLLKTRWHAQMAESSALQRATLPSAGQRSHSFRRRRTVSEEGGIAFEVSRAGPSTRCTLRQEKGLTEWRNPRYARWRGGRPRAPSRFRGRLIIFHGRRISHCGNCQLLPAFPGFLPSLKNSLLNPLAGLSRTLARVPSHARLFPSLQSLPPEW